MAEKQQENTRLVPYQNNNNGVSSPSSNNNGSFVSLFPPGYRFGPTDVELVEYYLKKKVMNQPIPYPEIMNNVIKEANVYDYNPEALVANHGKHDKKEWYFFTPRNRKYPNGKRPDRDVGLDGFWKSTVRNKEIYKSNEVGFDKELVGFKNTLVFYRGRARPQKTNWIMHEFTIPGQHRERESSEDMKLDDCVLCRIHKRGGKNEEQQAQSQGNQEDERLENSPLPIETEFNNGIINNSMVAAEDIAPICQMPKKSRIGNDPPQSYNTNHYLLPQNSSFNSLPNLTTNLIMSMNHEFNNGGFANNVMVAQAGNNGYYKNFKSQVPMETNFACSLIYTVDLDQNFGYLGDSSSSLQQAVPLPVFTEEELAWVEGLEMIPETICYP